MYGELLTRINLKLKPKEKILPLGEWAESQEIILDGRKFSFKNHEYLKAVYEDNHPYQVYLKACQLGLTSLAMLRAIYSARFRGFRGILYLFSHRSDVIDFSRGRIAPLIEENEMFREWIFETDSANLKKIWNAFLYLRGMKTKAGLKSLPIDLLIADEIDEASEEALEMAFERLSHSEFKEVLLLSNPSLPDFGIAAKFQETDQRYWLLKCEKCGEWINLVESFPDCLKRITKDKVIRACLKCGFELDIARGEWVAKKPEVIDKRGYQFSQLFSWYVDPKDILEHFEAGKDLTNFMNLKIGVPYVEASNRLSLSDVLSLCSDDGLLNSCSSGAVCMGIDVGRELYVVISRWDDGKDRIIYISVLKSWEELDFLMENFHVSRCVIDALPETRPARSFAERHKGRVFLAYYSIHQRGDFRWNEDENTVLINRTEALDLSHSVIINGRIILPRQSEMVLLFANHCCAQAKRLIEDEQTGSKFYEYCRLQGDDHFRHALSYLLVARSFLKNSLFSDSEFYVRED